MEVTQFARLGDGSDDTEEGESGDMEAFTALVTGVLIGALIIEGLHKMDRSVYHDSETLIASQAYDQAWGEAQTNVIKPLRERAQHAEEEVAAKDQSLRSTQVALDHTIKNLRECQRHAEDGSEVPTSLIWPTNLRLPHNSSIPRSQ